MQSNTTKQKVSKISGGLLALLTWFSLCQQYYVADITLINFFSFFTILSNLLVATSLTVTIIAPVSVIGRFFTKLSVQSAIAVYIFIVCVVYNLVLRGIVVLSGWQVFVDNMLHVVIPVLYLLYWTFFRTTGRLNWKDGLLWLLFPFFYLIYSLIRGAIVHWYPYPFLNAGQLGYGKVALNIAAMLLVFLITGLAFIFLARLSKTKKPLG